MTEPEILLEEAIANLAAIGASPVQPATVRDMQDADAAAITWQAYALPYDPAANPQLWLERVFGGKRTAESFDVARALPPDTCTVCGEPTEGPGMLDAKACQLQHAVCRGCGRYFTDPGGLLLLTPGRRCRRGRHVKEAGAA
jgi:hypothetical protein